MENIIDIAQYIYKEYKKQTGKNINEMKLHKLLYLVQREALALIGKSIFLEEFEAWDYSPVCSEVRSYYKTNNKSKRNTSLKNYYIIKNIVLQYGALDDSYLSDIICKEISWINALKSLGESKKMSLEDIKKDAEKVRPYDSLWDMYYDEFDDV